MAAPFTSFGYDGSVDEGGWATLSPEAGGVDYRVSDEPSWRATIVPNADRQLSLSTGMGSGKGVTDITDQPVVLPTFDTQSTGTRYDMVVARRTWGTNTTSFAIIKGGTTPTLPARNTARGTVDDQPLWLVPVVANGAGGALGTPIDLRLFQGESGAYARDELVLSYVTRLGSQIRIGDNLWQRTLNSTNSATWSRVGLSSIPLLGNSDALSNLPGLAAPAPAGADFKFQAGTRRGVSDEVGYARLTFPVPFPNGLLTVLLSSADDNALNGITAAVSGSIDPQHPWGFGNREWVVYRVWGPVNGGSDHYIIPNRAHRVNYLAIGW